MTVNTTDSRTGLLPGNGVTTTFPYAFKAIAASDLQVYLIDNVTMAATLQVVGQYSVVQNTNQVGGSVVFVTAPPTGKSVSIVRLVAVVQSTDITNQGSFFPETHESVWDRIVMMVQQQQDLIGRQLSKPVAGGVNYDAGGAIVGGAGTAVAGTDLVPLAQVSAMVAGAAGGIVPTLIATYPTLATAAGAGLVGFQNLGTGAVLRDMLTKMRETVSLKDFGAIGNGTTDDTAAVQAAVNACVASGKTLLVPAGKYRTTSVISVGGKLDMIGEGFSVDRGAAAPGAGSWFFFNHAGQGFFLITTQQGGIFQKFGTYRAHAAPGVGWAPTVYDYDFFMSPAANEWTFKDMMLLNPYKGIKCSNRPTIDNVKMHPFVEGICIDDCRDTARLQNIHMWCFWSEDANVTAYTLANLKAYRFLRVDNPTMVGCFCIYANKGLSIENGATGTTYALRASCLNFDGVVSGIVVDAAATGATMQISDVIAQNAYDKVSVGVGIQVAAASCQIIIAGLSGYDFPQGIVRVDGASNTVVVTSASLFNWDRLSAGNAAIFCATTSYLSVLDYSALNSFSTVALRFGGNVKTKHNDIIIGPVTVDSQADFRHAGNTVIMNSGKFFYLPGLTSGAAANLPNGTRITVVNLLGSGGNVNISAVSGVTLARNGTSANIVLTPGGAVTVLKVSDNGWLGL